MPKIKLTEEAKKRIIEEMEQFDPEDFAGIYCSAARVIGFTDSVGAYAQLKLEILNDCAEWEYLDDEDYSLKLIEDNPNQ